MEIYNENNGQRKRYKPEVFNLWAMAQQWAMTLCSVGHRAFLP